MMIPNWIYVITLTLCKQSSHHQGLVHVVFSPGAAVIILWIHSKAEEENINHILKNRKEAVRHQEGEHADNDKRQDPHGVVPLIV